MDKQKLHEMNAAVAGLNKRGGIADAIRPLLQGARGMIAGPGNHPALGIPQPTPVPPATDRVATGMSVLQPSVAGAVTPTGVANLMGLVAPGAAHQSPPPVALPAQPLKPQPPLGPMGATIHQKGGAFAVLNSQMWEAVNALNKKAFVPGPQVQQALEQMSSDAANQQQQQQATQQASQQAQAQQQGAPPTMRLEDLAQMIQQLAQMLQQLPQQIQQMIQPMMQQMSAAGGGEQKKLSPQEMNQQILQKLDQISQGLGVAPAGGAAAAGGAPGAAPSPAPGAANSPQQQPQQSAGQGQPAQ